MHLILLLDYLRNFKQKDNQIETYNIFGLWNYVCLLHACHLTVALIRQTIYLGYWISGLWLSSSGIFFEVLQDFE